MLLINACEKIYEENMWFPFRGWKYWFKVLTNLRIGLTLRRLVQNFSVHVRPEGVLTKVYHPPAPGMSQMKGLQNGILDELEIAALSSTHTQPDWTWRSIQNE